MALDRARLVAILCFAAAAVLVGVGNQTGERALTAIGFVAFAAGALAFFRWRGAQRARVLDPEDKTPPDGGPP
jgi:hypothetical protein